MLQNTHAYVGSNRSRAVVKVKETCGIINYRSVAHSVKAKESIIALWTINIFSLTQTQRQQKPNNPPYFFAHQLLVSHVPSHHRSTLLHFPSLTLVVFLFQFIIKYCFLLWRAGGGVGCSNAPPPEIPKALQNRVKLNPIVKTVKKNW